MSRLAHTHTSLALALALAWGRGLTLHSPFVSWAPTCTVAVLRVTLGQVLSKRSSCSAG